MLKPVIGLLILILTINISKAQEVKTFLDLPKLIVNPSLDMSYSPDNRQFTGISSLAVSPDGLMWAVWYAGITPGED